MFHDVLSGRPTGRPIRLRIEGWRGIHHSFAMVNQHQILALARHGGFELYHHDVPYFMGHWNARDTGAGFDAESAAVIDGLRDIDARQADAVLRIASPLQAPAADAPPTLSFAVTEFGMGTKGFADASVPRQRWCENGHRVITPSRWSRERLIDDGFPAEGVCVVPHGVDMRALSPLTAQEREASRAAIGLGAGTVAFLNVGVPTWNKGLDLLVRAFARVHRAYPDTRLILKDAKSLYGLSAEEMVHQTALQDEAVRDAGVLQSISLMQTSLTQPQLRSLFGSVDCYVSPYRAEGFNLPPLEALACGTPVIVSSGGSTNDFCHGAAVSRIASVFQCGALGEMRNAAWVEPHFEHLVALMMEAAAAGPNDPGSATQRPRREAALATAALHPWDVAAQAIHSLLSPSLARR